MCTNDLFSQRNHWEYQTSLWKNRFFCFVLVGLEFELGFMLAKQALYCLSHASSLEKQF
jgi:hypothetical protein